MSKHSAFATNAGTSNETTEATLAALATHIREFIEQGTLDTRCAAKLVKQLKKEAEAVADSSKATKQQQSELKNAFGAVDAALRDHEARLLVNAHATLRAKDGVEGAGQPN
ncbi:MAG TPA: hypothetical protein VMJ11_22610 [Paraburkholderia sp.]|uniref:hypothetical protein n=1 Tax=Paraburkholderia sp. TaxID=1926495 RepID=UPI002CA424C0|nr:hypothetical protein [Paraburkholderia sp.]HTR09389.1 hypothetical protein [Paraburkholderia sp.]